MDDTIVIILGALVGSIILGLLLVKFAAWLSNFQMELKYLNNEIERTTGHERKRWLAQRRRLWLSIIPFIRY